MELNREQIVKALECCTRGRKSKDDRPCLECQYNECNLVGGTSERQTTGTCQGWLMKDALSLIKELKDEKNEVFEKGCENLTRLEEAYLKLESENLKLTEENERHKAEQHEQFDKWLKLEEATKRHHAELFEEAKIAVKEDTVRKMQERLKAKAKNNEWNGTICGVDIDQVAKEMLEGEK